MSDNGEDVETLIRLICRDHEGVDLVLGICYNDGESKQRAFTIKTAGDPEMCRKLTHMVWEAVKGKPQPQPQQQAEDPTEEEE